MLSKLKECFSDCLAQGVVFLIMKLDDEVLTKINETIEEDLLPAPGEKYKPRHIDLGEVDGIWTTIV